MKANNAGQQALITILNKIYNEIRIIEERLGIRLDGSDFRPRIEHFHDAIRTLSSGAVRDERLSVEFLAYDVAMLRRIQANPLVSSKDANTLSPKTDIATLANTFNSMYSKASEKLELAEHYKNYSVLFVALLTEAADRDYQSKVDQGNEIVENVVAVEKEVKQSAHKRDTSINLEELVHRHIDDPELIRQILSRFGNKKNKIIASEAAKQLSEMIKETDKKIKAVEQAHFSYVTGQLAIYENAKEVVKKMVMNGLNIVGNFVENAVHEATRGTGRRF